MSSQLPQKPVRVIKGEGGSDARKFRVLRFNTPTTVKLTDILSHNVMMKRIFDPSMAQEDVPLEGEGSEFGWKSKQARLAAKYNVKAITEEQCPWELKDKNDKLYHGRKEGGITANSCYIAMREVNPGVYEASLIEDWVTLTNKINYTTLNEEEAEMEFSKRHLTQNHYNLMLQKRININLKKQQDYENAQLKIHDVEDFLGDSDDAGEDINEDAAKRKRKLKKFKKSKNKEDDELNNEKSDEDTYDEYKSKEVDYISESESDDSVDEAADKPGAFNRKEHADEEGALFQESDSENEDNSMKKIMIDDDESESSDIDENSEEFKSLMAKNKIPHKSDLKRERSLTPVNSKKAEPPNKKARIDTSALTEENVWRYISRKPVSTKELIAKFKTKKSGLNKNEMVMKLSSILKKIASQEQKDGKNYFVVKDSCKNMYPN